MFCHVHIRPGLRKNRDCLAGNLVVLTGCIGRYKWVQTNKILKKRLKICFSPLVFRSKIQVLPICHIVLSIFVNILSVAQVSGLQNFYAGAAMSVLGTDWSVKGKKTTNKNKAKKKEVKQHTGLINTGIPTDRKSTILYDTLECLLMLLRQVNILNHCQITNIYAQTTGMWSKMCFFNQLLNTCFCKSCYKKESTALLGDVNYPMVHGKTQCEIQSTDQSKGIQSKSSVKS